MTMKERRAAGRSHLQPLGDRIIVHILDEDEVATTASGIVLPDTAKERPQRGKVVAVGPGPRDEDGEHVKMDVEEGDEIIFSKYGGTEIKVGSDEVLILRESDVLLVDRGARGRPDSAGRLRGAGASTFGSSTSAGRLMVGEAAPDASRRVAEEEPALARSYLDAIDAERAFRVNRLLVGALGRAQVFELLGDAAPERIENLIQLVDSSGEARFPSWQFVAHPRFDVVPGLEQVLSELALLDPLAKCEWLLGFHTDLGASPLEALRRRGVVRVSKVARSVRIS